MNLNVCFWRKAGPSEERQARFIPRWSSRSRYPEVKYWPPTIRNSASRSAV